MARLDKLEKLVDDLKKGEKEDYDQRFAIEGYKGLDLVTVAGVLTAQLANQRGLPAVVVGRDIRNNSYIIADAFATGVLSQGINVVDIGVTTTPNCEYVGNYLGLPNATVTASHMASEETGLKVHLQKEGEVRCDELSRMLMESTAFGGKRLYGYERATELLYERLARIPSGNGKVRVCIDSAHGVSSIFLKKMLMERGVDVVRAIRDTPDGNFPTLLNNAPDPTKYQNLGQLAAALQDSKADLGFFLDGDGDRTVALLGDGRALDAVHMAGLYAGYFSGSGVGSYVLDPMIEFLAPVLNACGITPAVADKRGRPKMKETIAEKAAWGGAENSYHFYDKEGIDCGIANVLYMVEICKGDLYPSLERLNRSLPFYSPELRVEIEGVDVNSELDTVKSYSSEKGYEIREEDGIKISDGKNFLRVRASANEPGVVTAIFWNSDKDQAGAETFVQDVLSGSKLTEKIMSSYQEEKRVRVEYFYGG